MSEILTTQDTSESSLSDLKKPRGRPRKETTEPKSVPIFQDEAQKLAEFPQAQIVDTTNIHKISPQVQADHLIVAAQMQQLDANVEYCKHAGIEWLEVDGAILRHFNKGKDPAEEYIIYKNIRLTTKGKAETIAAREKLNCHQVLFPDEGYMKVR